MNRGDAADQPASAELSQGRTVSGGGEDRLRAGAELQFQDGNPDTDIHEGIKALVKNHWDDIM